MNICSFDVLGRGNRHFIPTHSLYCAPGWGGKFRDAPLRPPSFWFKSLMAARRSLAATVGGCQMLSSNLFNWRACAKQLKGQEFGSD